MKDAYTGNDLTSVRGTMNYINEISIDYFTVVQTSFASSYDQIQNEGTD